MFIFPSWVFIWKAVGAFAVYDEQKNIKKPGGVEHKNLPLDDSVYA